MSEGQVTTRLTDQSCASNQLASSAQQLHSHDRKKSGEMFVLSRLFHQAGAALELKYPADVILGESPDCLIVSGTTVIGVEITKFKPEQLGRAESLARQDNRGMFTANLNFSSPPRTNDEILSQMAGHQAGLGDWVDSEAQLEANADQLRSVVDKKTRKIVALNAHKVDEYWLVIEDCLNLSREDAKCLMADLHTFLATRGVDGEFDRIYFIMLDDVLGFQKGNRKSQQEPPRDSVPAARPPSP